MGTSRICILISTSISRMGHGIFIWHWVRICDHTSIYTISHSPYPHPYPIWDMVHRVWIWDMGHGILLWDLGIENIGYGYRIWMLCIWYILMGISRIRFPYPISISHIPYLMDILTPYPTSYIHSPYSISTSMLHMGYGIWLSGIWGMRWGMGDMEIGCGYGIWTYAHPKFQIHIPHPISILYIPCL